MKTICLIELKLTELIEQVNESLYTNFQSILKFYENFIIFNFKAYRGLLWSCKHPYKLKQLENLLILSKNELKIT